MEMMAMADINEYLDGLDIKFSEQEKQLADIFAESWEYCRSHTCGDCEYAPNGKYVKMLLCMSCQYAKRLIAADVAPVKHGHWVYNQNGHDWGLGAWECSLCHSVNNNLPIDKRFSPYVYAGSKYCPNCGAKMDGGENNGT